MIVKLLTEHPLEFLSLKGGCRGSSESTFVKMPHCWKSHALPHIISVTGNSDTLKHSPAAKGIDVYGRLRDFFNRNYTAQYMTLAVHSKRKYKSFKVCLCAHSKRNKVMVLKYQRWILPVFSLNDLPLLHNARMKFYNQDISKTIIARSFKLRELIEDYEKITP